MASALDLTRVSAGYGETVVIEDIDLKLSAGECISVIGRNSCTRWHRRGAETSLRRIWPGGS